MSKKTLYTGYVHTVGGREGNAKSSDGELAVKLSRPGSNLPGTNPEQLFAAGWSACFEGALAHAARELGVKLPGDTAVDAEVSLHLDEVDGYSLTAHLNVSLPGLPENVAQSLIERAHETCPYSKMTRNGIEATVALAVNA